LEYRIIQDDARKVSFLQKNAGCNFREDRGSNLKYFKIIKLHGSFSTAEIHQNFRAGALGDKVTFLSWFPFQCSPATGSQSATRSLSAVGTRILHSAFGKA